MLTDDLGAPAREENELQSLTKALVYWCSQVRQFPLGGNHEGLQPSQFSGPSLAWCLPPGAVSLLILCHQSEAPGRPVLCGLILVSSDSEGQLFFPRELYPVLMRALQTLPTELSTHPLRPLSMQRMASLLTLLTQLTLAASSTHPESTR